MVLCSLSISELQITEWSLDVNVLKTKVVVFRNGGKSIAMNNVLIVLKM